MHNYATANAEQNPKQMLNLQIIHIINPHINNLPYPPVQLNTTRKPARSTVHICTNTRDLHCTVSQNPSSPSRGAPPFQSLRS